MKPAIKRSALYSCIFFGCFTFLTIGRENFALADTAGQNKVFFIDSSYDNFSREKIETVLEKVSQNAYFYIETDFAKGLSEADQAQLAQDIDALSFEFDNVIYPKLTTAYGSEWKKGIDNDERITIVLHRLKKAVAGYFRTEDEYPFLQAQKSNEREMIYLNADYISKALAKSFLAHEFVHLITFNQKDRLKGLQEEVWLNEARADFASFLLGYDDDFQGSSLQQRITEFLYSSSDSLTDWANQKSDYGIATIFLQYVAEHYGNKIISSSMEARLVGFDSLNFALQKWGEQKTIEQIFTDFSVAVFLNDCQAGLEYCFRNKNLANFGVVPSLIFLSTDQIKNIAVDFTAKPWSLRWYRILAKDGDLKLAFKGAVRFRLPFVLCDKQNMCKVDFLEPKVFNTAELFLPKFADQFYSLTLIPSVQPLIKTLSDDNQEPTYNFGLTVFLEQATSQDELTKGLLEKIEALKTQIAILQAQLANMQSQNNICSITKDLYFGKKNEQVFCLQAFLQKQGQAIYPEGIISGFFGVLTQKAVVRFQSKYAIPATGYVGKLTKAKINSLSTQ